MLQGFLQIFWFLLSVQIHAGEIASFNCLCKFVCASCGRFLRLPVTLCRIRKKMDRWMDGCFIFRVKEAPSLTPVSGFVSHFHKV